MPRLLQGSWIDNYLEYTKDTESPESYNLWSGLSVLSGTLKRKVYMKPKGNFYHLFPNQYIVLVGPPGIGKGTAITPAVALAKKADRINFLSDRITAEKIVEKLANGFQKVAAVPQGSGVAPGNTNVKFITESSALVISKELPVFLGSSDWMLPLLCQLWDENEFDYDTKNKGTKHIENLCVGLIGGCVPDYIRRINRDTTAAITGGFTSRCVFVYATKRSKDIAWVDVNQAQTKLEGELVSDMQYISQIEGEVKFSLDARKLWDDFYRSNSILDRFEQEVVVNFKSRMPSHILKCAMTLCVAEDDSLVISEAQLDRAITLVDQCCQDLTMTFRSVGESTLTAALSKVMDFIEHKGKCTRTEILRTCYKDVTDEDLARILTTLKSMGCIGETQQQGRLYYEDLKNRVKV